MPLTLGASNATSYRNMLYLKDAKSRMDKEFNEDIERKENTFFRG